MNRSHQNTSNKATGFVYFNTEPYQEPLNKSDTTDFLGFSDQPQASPQPNRFRPAHYSSPQPKFQRGSPRNYPQNNRRYQRWSGGGGSRSANSSWNSSFSQSGSFRDDEDSDVTKFIHPSFLEDPWAPLEAKLKQQSQDSAADDSIQPEMEET